MVWIMSGKFPDGLDYVWKVSGLSGKLLAGLKVSMWSRKFLNSLEIF